MNRRKIALKILSILKKEYSMYQTPVSTYFQETTKDAFKVLISTILSARSRDSQTEKVSKELFKIAGTPEKLTKLNYTKLCKIIYSIGFYKIKSKRIKKASRFLLEHYNGKVPKTREELLKIPGVGRKVANIVLAECFNVAAIAVDVHQNRLPNRMGFIKTKNPLETEKELMKIYPKVKWSKLNRYFVVHGQNICLPISPKCGICKVEKYCKKIGVKNHRQIIVNKP